jgi:hypothetical protein
MHCILRPDGALHDCVVVALELPGRQFGDEFTAATLEAANGFRIIPLIQDGMPIERELVTVSIVWLLR